MQQEPINELDNKVSEFNFNNADNVKSDDKNTNQENQNDYDELNEDLLKYDDINYTKSDRINYIKKIEMYLNDPDLKKLAMRKIHIKEYLVKSKLVKLDVKMLNYVYDQLKDFDLTSGLSETCFNTYLSINNLVESALCKLNIDVSGYSDCLDNFPNRLLVKQITIDNFNYISGQISPEMALILNTGMVITGTYKNNRKLKAIKEQNENNTVEDTKNENLIEENSPCKDINEIKDKIILESGNPPCNDKDDNNVTVNLTEEEKERLNKIKKFINS